MNSRTRVLSITNTSMTVYSKLQYIILYCSYCETDHVDIYWESLTKRHECEKVFLVASSHSPFSFPSNCSLMDRQDFQIWVTF